jgi:hypothetical protein
MTIAIGKSNQKRGLFDVADDWLRRDRFVLLVGQVYCYYLVHICRRWLVNRNNFRYFMVYTWFSKFIPRRV